jgi:hypothetical protein
MTMPLRRLIVLAAFELALAAAAAAQESPADGEAETGRRYAVEVIIFEYTEPDSVGTEVFVPERLPDEADADPLGAEAFTDVPATDPAPVPGAEPGLRPLGEDELAMTDMRNMLVRLQAYEPLMHFGWVQETVPDTVSRPLPLELFGTPPGGLAGTLSLSLSRFLHLAVDLTLAADEPYMPPRPPAALPAEAGEDGTALPQASQAPRYAPLEYALAETRIIRSGETRYYDHPRFGVIARVTRADLPGPGAATGRR